MEAKKQPRLFVNPLPIWTGLALKASEAVLASAQAAAAGANAVRVAVLPEVNEAVRAATPRINNGRKRKAKRRAKRR